MPNVNPEILRWARESSGLSLEEAAERLKIEPARGMISIDRLAALERGQDQPSRPLLVRMAKQYRRPLLAFYLGTPPRRGDRGQDFRTLPADRRRTDDALVDALIRNVRARQGMVKAVLESEDDAAPLPFIASQAVSNGVPAVAKGLREVLGVSLEDFRGCSTPQGGFDLLRGAAEASGVFVLLIGNLGSYHSTLDLELFRGFALADEVAPFVVINDQDSKAAWSFTLLHELTHLLLGATGVSGENAAGPTETFCNEVAAEFLLPTVELRACLQAGLISRASLEHTVRDFAAQRNLSSSMVAFRLLRLREIDSAEWGRLNARFRSAWLQSREKERDRAREREGGPNYYVVKRHKLGKGLTSFVDRMIGVGALSTSKAAHVLGVKAKQVGALLDTYHTTHA